MASHPDTSDPTTAACRGPRGFEAVPWLAGLPPVAGGRRAGGFSSQPSSLKPGGRVSAALPWRLRNWVPGVSGNCL